MPTVYEMFNEEGWTRATLDIALRHFRRGIDSGERNQILDYVEFESHWPDWVCEVIDELEAEIEENDLWPSLNAWYRSQLQLNRQRWNAPIRRKASDTFVSNPYPYYVGVEIETNESDVNKYVTAKDVETIDEYQAIWDCQHDGSLENGSEFALREIKNGDAILTEVTAFCEMLKDYGYKTDHSCGVHVHVDFTEGNLDTLKRAINMYRKYEPIIYDFVGADRIRKRFSKPLTDSSWKTIDFPPLREAMRTNNLRAFKVSYYDRERYESLETYKYYDGRYFGTNIHSVFLNNTLEFRHLEGTLDSRKINTWIMTNLALVDHCMRGFDPEIEDRIFSDNTPTLEEFCVLLPNNVAEDFKEIRLEELNKRKEKKLETWVDIEESL